MKNLYCSFVGHRFKVSKNVTDYVKEYKCLNCDLQMTTDGKGKLTKLTPKFEEINDVLERIHRNRRNKKHLVKKLEFVS